MKNSKLLFTVVYLILISLFVFVIETRNFDRLIQFSIIFGAGLGFYSAHKQGEKSFYYVILTLTALFPVLVWILSGLINQEIRGLQFTAVMFLAFYIPTIVGYVLKKLRISDELKLAILFGIIFTFLSAATRKLNHGTSASITILLAGIVVTFLSPKSKAASMRFLFVFNSIYLLLNILLGSFPDVLQMSLLLFCIVLISIISHVMRFSSFSKVRKLSWLLSVTMFISIFGWFGQENYETWFFAKLNNESIQEKVDYTFLTTENVRISSIDSADRKIIVLFWSEACASCKEEFPYFSELASKYENDSSKLFLAAYLSLKEDDTAYYNQITAQPFNFYWGRAANSEILMKQLKMTGVPHLTIIDEQNNAIYNGHVSNRPWIWVNRPSGFF
jgi:thiol-disulfide isomerase/thioredoxin